MQWILFVWYVNLHLIHVLVVSIKTNIGFNIHNVPSLIRCKRNGRLFYFDYFPTDQSFYDTIINQTYGCDFTITSAASRIIFEVEKLDLSCHLKLAKLEDRVHEMLYFKSNCSGHDRCLRLTPPAATIITNYVTKSEAPLLFNLDLDGIGTGSIRLGDRGQNSYSVDERDHRTLQTNAFSIPVEKRRLQSRWFQKKSNRFQSESRYLLEHDVRVGSITLPT